MSSLDDLELGFEFVFTAWVAVRMVLERELSKCFLNLFLSHTRLYAQVLVVVSERIDLNHVDRGVWLALGCAKVESSELEMAVGALFNHRVVVKALDSWLAGSWRSAVHMRCTMCK